ncbi:HYR domain-containing protein [Thalassobellus sediminis]|uniref:HYR domain-containing protein n=1 Tax=Thalassobellus sediminis TaxID=3367753 RepID=UPI00378C68A0
MKKIIFYKIFFLFFILLSSSNINARNLSNNPTPATPIYNIQYKVVSFFVELFDDDETIIIDNDKSSIEKTSITSVANCIGNYTINLDATGNAILDPANLNNGSTGGGALSFSADRTSFSCADIGLSPITITLTVTDTSDNSTDTCTTQVTVEDNVPPTALCQNITIQLDAAGNASIVADDIDGGSSDNCGFTLSASQTAFTCANLGANNVTLTVNDGNGQTDTCVAVVTVEDNVPPTITCPGNISTNNDSGNCSTVVTYNVTSSDNCTGEIITQTLGLPSGSAFPVGTTTNTFVVTDTSGNTSTCSFNVTITDTEDPTISCPSNITQNTDPGLCSAIINYTIPTGTDNCPGAITTQTDVSGLTSGDAFPLGVTVIEYTVTDNANRQVSCSFTVTVIDNVDPVTPILADITGECTATATVPQTTDICAGVINGTTTDQLTYSTQGTHVINWTFNDGNGNFITVPQNVIIEDTTDPIIPSLPTITHGCSYSPSVPTTTDNCSGTLFGSTNISFPITTTTTIPWVFDDGNGNIITANQIIIIDPITISLDSKSDVLCYQGNVGAINVSVTGGTPNYTYSWVGPGGFTSSSEDISNLIAGTYGLTLTDTNNCSATYNVVITQPTNLSGTIAKIEITCKDANDGVATINPSGGIGPYTYVWNTGETSQTISNLAPGNYWVDVTDANNCTSRVTTTYSNPTELITSGSFTQPSCNGDSDGTATVTASGGTAPYFYLWSNNAGVGLASVDTVSNLPTGFYSVTVTDSSGCSEVVFIQVTEPDVLTHTVLGQEGCFGGTGGSATAVPNGGTGPFTYLWNTGATTQTITNLIPGTYSVTVTDVNGCFSSSVSVTNALPTQLGVSATGINTTGPGLSNGSATANPTGGDEPYTYLWDDGQTTQTATGLTDGTYTVVVTDESGCTATTSINIGDPLVISMTTSSECIGEDDVETMTIVPVIQGGQAPYTYSWDFGLDAIPATGTNSGTQSVEYATAGDKIITLTVSDNTGQSVTITQIHNIRVCFEYNVDCDRCVSNDYDFTDFFIGDENGTPIEQCSGGDALPVYVWFTITSNAQPKYNLYVIAGYQVTDPFTGLATTQSVEDCIYPGSPAIPIPDGQGRLLLDSDYICGSEIEITGLLFSWKQRAQNSCGPAAPKCFCAAGDLTVETPLTAFINGTDALCFGDNSGTATVEAFGGTEPYSYLWSDGQTGATATGLIAGVYTVVVSDADGTTLPALSVTIGQPTSYPDVTATAVDLNGVNVSCFGDTNGSATAVASGGTPPYTYLWSNGQTTATASSLGVGDYTVTVTDLNGCIITDTVTLIGPDEIVLSIAPTDPTCFGFNNGSATASVTSGGTAPYSYQWNNGDTTATANNLQANVSYSVTVTDVNNCTSTTSITLSQPQQLTVATSRTNTECFGDSSGTGTAIPSGGTAPYSYLWFDGQTTQTATGLPAGGPYTVTVTDAQGCQQGAQVIISNAPVITATASSSDLLCFGDTNGTVSVIANGGTPGYTYAWDTTPVQTTSTVSGLGAGTYTVTITDSKNCQVTASTTISEPTELTASITGQNLNCFGDNSGSASVTVSGGTTPYTITWSDGQTGLTATGLNATTHNVSIVDANFCTRNLQISLNQPLEITDANAGVDQTPLCGTENITLAANNPAVGEGLWTIISGPIDGNEVFSNPSSPSSNFYSPNEGTYVLRWTISDNINSCPSKTDEMSVTFSTCSSLDFDGIDDNVNFNNNFNLNSTPFSIEVWIKSETTNTNTQTILSKRFANNLSTGYDLRLVNNKISFNWNGSESIASNYNIDGNRWYHITVAFDGSNYNLYIDGILLKTTTGNAPIINNADFILGAMDQNINAPFRPVNYFYGWLDELKIWNIALNEDQIHQMMNQEIENNGALVRGSILNEDIAGLTWNNLISYYQMNQSTTDIANGYLMPNAGSSQGKLINITTWQEETAPLPYFTKNSGTWIDTSISTPWQWGNSVWDYPNSNGIGKDINDLDPSHPANYKTPIDWNIVVSSHNLLSESKDITLLGLLMDTPNTKLTITSPGANQDETNSGHGLWITHYLKLDGIIDLVGESQLIQKRYTDSQVSESILDVTSGGHIEQDQQGSTNYFNYNYWSSPVSIINTSNNNVDHNVSTVMFDGTNSATPLTLQWTNSAFANPSTSGKTLSRRWIYAYENYASNTYAKWRYLGETSNFKVGLGYTMKGSGAASTLQNYVFIGKPNNGTITSPITIGNDALIGNPYPSALDAQEFIKDNIPLLNPNGGATTANPNTTGSINGSLYFWIHFDSNNTHVLKDYEGGYAIYTLAGGISPPTGEVYNTTDNFYISGSGSSSLIPGDYIPVGQGFFTSSASTNKISNNIKFENDQRDFQRESSTNSIFLKSRKTKNNNDNSSNTISGNDNPIQRIRLIYSTPEGARRYLLLAFTPNNEASDNFDYGYDAKVLDNNPNDMLFLIDNEKYVIQGVGVFNDTKQYPIGLFSKTGGSIEIAVSELENMPADTKVYIYDSLLGTYTKINGNNQKFETSLDVGDYTDRFFITFAKDNNSLSDDDIILDNVIVNYLKNSKEIFIKIPSNNEVKQVYLTNMLGQTIKTWNKTNSPSLSNEMRIPVSKSISEGTYIIIVQTPTGSMNKKVVIDK